MEWWSTSVVKKKMVIRNKRYHLIPQATKIKKSDNCDVSEGICTLIANFTTL